MANPNLMNASVFLVTSGTLVTSTNEEIILNNAANSGKIFNIKLVRLFNIDSVSRTVTLKYYPQESGGGTAVPLITTASIASKGFNDYLARFYLVEDRSISVQASAADVIQVLYFYSEMS